VLITKKRHRLALEPDLQRILSATYELPVLMRSGTHDKIRRNLRFVVNRALAHLNFFLYKVNYEVAIVDQGYNDIKAYVCMYILRLYKKNQRLNICEKIAHCLNVHLYNNM